MYKKVLVPLDGSELAECVFPHVESMVEGCGIEDIIFIRVVEPLRVFAGYYNSPALTTEIIKRTDLENKASAENYLGQVMNRIAHDGVNIKSEVMAGKAAESIVEYATKNSIDLIIIATHGRSGISRWAYGSVAERVLRSACVPVLMIRAPGCVPGI